jgi:exonuclease III
MMVSTFDIEGSDQKLLVVNLHMSAYDASGTLREQEMAFLKSFLEEQQTLGNYVIVGGDFNQTFPGAEDIYPTQEGLWEAYPIETDFLPAGYRFEYDATQPSCRLLNQPYDPTDDMTQYYIIDGFIVSSNIETLAYDGITVGAKTLNENFKYSDHNPVVLTFKLL